jgi:DNA mismatch endonuclease, patch repair protein
MEKYLKKFLRNGKFNRVSAKRSKTMSAIHGKNNYSTELRLRMALVREGVKGWTTNVNHLPGHPDFYFPKKRLTIFVDGCFWHGCQRCGHIPKTNRAFWKAKILRNYQRDQIARRKLNHMGVRVMHIWEHKLKKPVDLSVSVERIVKYLKV